MPIKWQPFKGPQKPSRSPLPFGNDLEPDAEEWITPFMPHARPNGPEVDIYQDKNNLYLEISLGGVNPENVEVSMEDNIVIINGKSEDQQDAKEKDYLRKEIRKGTFRRVIKLPVRVRSDKAAAESYMGILKITIPKMAKSAARATKIPIKIK